MSRLYRIHPLATFLTVLALFTFALAVSPHGAARAASARAPRSHPATAWTAARLRPR